MAPAPPRRRSTRSPVGALAVVGLLGAVGCGVVVDADRFRNVASESGNGGPPSATLTPDWLYEGAGGPRTVGRGAPIIVSGGPFADGVRLESDDPGVLVGPVMRSANGSRLGAPVWVDPRPALAEGETATVTLALLLPDGGSIDLAMTIEGLDELALAGRVDTSALRPRYSRVETSSITVFTGTAAVRLWAEGSIELRHPVSVAAAGVTPGPGGSAGGDSGQAGGGVRGGAPGPAAPNGCASGGGGAGGRVVGEPAADADGGDAALMPFAPSAQLGGHGGGGGGAGSRSEGLAGGGGGGILWLRSPVVRIDAAIDASGAPGASWDNSSCGQDNGGAGGGGAGGFALIQARDDLRGVGGIRVAGGAGGAGGNKAGGAGAPGWVRVDAPVVPTPLQTEDLIRGPAWTSFGPIVRPSDALAFVAGDPDGVVVLVDGERVPHNSDGGGGQILLPADPGLYALCVVVLSSADSEESEACVSVAVLP